MSPTRDASAAPRPNRHGEEMATILYVRSGADAYGPNQGRVTPAETYMGLLGAYRLRLKAQHEVRKQKGCKRTAHR
jgi:hypothetical protein